MQYSICDGAGEHKKKYQYFSGSMILLLAASFLLTAVILAGRPTLLKLFGARGEIFDLGAEYIRFIALGTIFQMFGTGLVPFIRNMGGVIAAMAAMIAGFVTNMILDYVLVWVLPYGIAGAAVATVIGQAVTLAVCLGYLLLRKTKVLVSIKDSWKSVTKEVLLVAISPFGLAFSPNITLILVNRSAATYGGDQAVTTYATISYVAWVVLALLQGISDGCPASSQHLSWRRRSEESPADTEYGLSVCSSSIAGLHGNVVSDPLPCGTVVWSLFVYRGKYGAGTSGFYCRISVYQFCKSHNGLFLCNGKKCAGISGDLWRVVSAVCISDDLSHSSGNYRNLGFCAAVPDCRDAAKCVPVVLSEKEIRKHKRLGQKKLTNRAKIGMINANISTS